MEYLQYNNNKLDTIILKKVLNLIINGIPSILNTHKTATATNIVLNLIINGIPSIPAFHPVDNLSKFKVLNLIINGIPSIHTEW